MLCVPIFLCWCYRSHHAISCCYFALLLHLFLRYSDILAMGSTLYVPVLFVQYPGVPVLNRLPVFGMPYQECPIAITCVTDFGLCTKDCGCHSLPLRAGSPCMHILLPIYCFHSDLENFLRCSYAMHDRMSGPNPQQGHFNSQENIRARDVPKLFLLHRRTRCLHSDPKCTLTIGGQQVY